MGLFHRRNRGTSNKEYALTQSSSAQDFAVIEDAPTSTAEAVAGTQVAANGNGAKPAARALAPTANPLLPSAPPSVPLTAPTTAAAVQIATPAQAVASGAQVASVPAVSRLDPALEATALRMIDGNSKAEPVIAVRGLTKVYQMGDIEVAALRGVDLNIYPGEMSAIMGPSGSGKSTLMNIIGCLDIPSSGSYLLDGVDVSRLSDDALATIRGTKIGFVFQSFNLLARTSAQDNVELPLIYSGTSGRDRKRRAQDVLQLVGLGDRMHHKPNELSGGQQQRVAIARALINEPAMILADEPTGNLDTRTSLEIMELFQRLNVEQGITIVFVTHNNETAEYCHRVIRVRDGVVESDIRHRPTAGIYGALQPPAAANGAPVSVLNGAVPAASPAHSAAHNAGNKS